MPKYKEIKINVKMTPDVILGNMLREIMALNANQQTTTNTEKMQTNNKSDNAE